MNLDKKTSLLKEILYAFKSHTYNKPTVTVDECTEFYGDGASIVVCEKTDEDYDKKI